MRRRPPRSTLFSYTTLFRSQRGAQAVERGTQAFVNLLGGGQQSTGHQRRNGQQNSSPRQVLCRSKQRLRVVERSEEHTSELQSHSDLVCRLLLEKKN